jgi:hypothetical protein
MKRCLEYSRDWSASRVQWGAPIGQHAAIADKLARMAANALACEAMVMLTSALVDREKADIRIEAAMCKLWSTEAAWTAVDETMQIRGGRGYETAQSLANRGEAPVPIERMLRDCRINRIFEGSSEIMRLFLAREALDPHLKAAAGALDTRRPLPDRAKTALGAAGFYAGWFPSRFLPRFAVPADLTPAFKPALAAVSRDSRRLARMLFYRMAKFGPKLEKQQLLLGRVVDIGTELFATTATLLYGDALIKTADPRYPRAELEQLVNCFSANSRLRVAEHFRALRHQNDRGNYKLAQSLLDGRHAHLQDGLV